MDKFEELDKKQCHLICHHWCYLKVCGSQWIDFLFKWWWHLVSVHILSFKKHEGIFCRFSDFEKSWWWSWLSYGDSERNRQSSTSGVAADNLEEQFDVDIRGEVVSWSSTGGNGALSTISSKSHAVVMLLSVTLWCLQTKISGVVILSLGGWRG